MNVSGERLVWTDARCFCLAWSSVTLLRLHSLYPADSLSEQLCRTAYLQWKDEAWYLKLPPIYFFRWPFRLISLRLFSFWARLELLFEVISLKRLIIKKATTTTTQKSHPVELSQSRVRPSDYLYGLQTCCWCHYFYYFKTIYLYDVTVTFLWCKLITVTWNVFLNNPEQRQKHDILEHFKSRKSSSVPIESPR